VIVQPPTFIDVGAVITRRVPTVLVATKRDGSQQSFVAAT